MIYWRISDHAIMREYVKSKDTSMRTYIDASYIDI
jgi:hypothetical protein